MPDKLEPLPCPGCGEAVSVTEIYPFVGWWRVMCVAHTLGDCWCGSAKANRAGAIIAWNTVRTRTRLVRGRDFCGWVWQPTGILLNRCGAISVLFFCEEPDYIPSGYDSTEGEWVRVRFEKV